MGEDWEVAERMARGIENLKVPEAIEPGITAPGTQKTCFPDIAAFLPNTSMRSERAFQLVTMVFP